LISFRLLPVFALLLSFSGTSGAQSLFVKPVKVLGDPAFVATAGNPTLIEGNGPNVVEGREFSTPLGIALDTSVSPPVIYVADSGNNRVLGFRYATQLVPGSVADIVLGQADRFSNLPNGPGVSVRTTGLSTPTAIAVDSSGNVYVADTGNNRIVRFPKPALQPSGSNQLPDMVLGQSSFGSRTANNGGISAKTLSLNSTTSIRNGLAFDSSGNLWVSDSANNRVLRYPAGVLSSGASGGAADVVLGQNDFVSSVAATSVTSKTAMIGPQGLAIDPTGRVLVADSGGRVLVYPAGVSGTGAVATRILGVDPTTTSLTTQIAVSRPLGLVATTAGVVVADTFNHRVLLFPTVDQWASEATQFSPSATAVVGQTSYTASMPNQGNGDASASSFNYPADVAVAGSELFVVDFQNSRVLVFGFGPTGISSSATRVIGQLDFPYDAANLIEGKEFNFGTSMAILDQSVSPPRLYVADSQNNRILGYSDFSKVQVGLRQADIVIGQPDFYRNQINYPTNNANTPNQQSLHNPTALAVDGAGDLYVADTGNSRILRFPAPFASGKTALESADLVIGQTGFTSIVTDPTAQTMSAPSGIALTADAFKTSTANSGWLIATDSVHNRVLFFQKPFTSGMSATKLLGSGNYNVVNLAGGSGGPQLHGPHGVAVDANDRVLVADTLNSRVQVFNTATAINNYDTPPISLSVSQPATVGVAPVGFWVASPGTGSLIHFPDVSQLGIKNNNSDGSLTAYGPLSGFADSYSNLLVCDSANRVLYFAPQVALVSAASFSSRALTPGMLASAFPAAGTTNIISSGTGANGSSFPLPTTLSDTQVLVNGTPAPLFFVSPGQINFQLSNSLTGGGTADLQVTRPSTGQVYGGQEIQLASADPALFTSNGTGGGQVAALNFPDYSVNSSSNPIVRGQTIILYGTGVGPIPNAPPDGQPAPAALSSPSAPQILLGATATAFVPASNVTFSGISSLVGVWQINLTIPTDAPTGSSVPIRIFQNSIPSIDPSQTGIANTTIAIK
jgi:uncharacterized protein (TIGR03437 family)